MRVATCGVASAVDETTVDAALAELIRRLDGEPDLVLGYYTHDVGGPVFEALRRRLRTGAFAGASSSGGVMTDEGLFGFDGPGFALWGVCDPDGDYGTAYVAFDGPDDAAPEVLDRQAKAAARRAYDAAIARADRVGELPELIWVLSVPGHEEAVLAGLDEMTGGQVPITGGSAAAETVVGGWTCFAGDGIGGFGVAVMVMFPSTRLAWSFQSGFEPAGPSGIVTRTAGRHIEEIDGRPAAEVYNGWTGGLVAPETDGAGDPDFFDRTVFAPLGREVGRFSVDQQTIPYFSLMHPATVTATHGLVAFAQVTEGERIFLMQGSIESMVSRAGRVADAARSLLADGRAGNPDIEPAGGLVIYCAGCMRAVAGELPRVVKEVSVALGGAPFIGAFTFGEQGCLLGGENKHGNLMISTAVFER